MAYTPMAPSDWKPIAKHAAHTAISRLPPAVPAEGPEAREQQEDISAAALGLRFNEESALSEDRYEYAMAFLRVVSRDSLGALSHGVSLLYGQLKRGSSSAWSNRSNATDSIGGMPLLSILHAISQKN